MMSNNLYHIIPTSDSELLIIVRTWMRPDSFLKELTADLDGLSKDTTVVFDFLVKNGAKDRFYKSYFDSNSSALTSFKKCRANKEIKQISNVFFMDNPELLENSSLTRAQKFLFRKELAI